MMSKWLRFTDRLMPPARGMRVELLNRLPEVKTAYVSGPYTFVNYTGEIDLPGALAVERLTDLEDARFTPDE